MVAPVPAPATPAASAATPSNSAPSGQSAAVTSTPLLPAPAPSIAVPAKGEIAFTAVLTPMKDATATAGTADTRQMVTAPDTIADELKLSTPAVSNLPQAPAVQSSPSQAAFLATGKDPVGAQAGGDMEQDGETPSQQDDSTETPERVIAPANAANAKDNQADVKQPDLKQAGLKQDDSGLAVATQDHPPVADAALTSFPDQAHASAATQSNPTAAIPAPFESTAQALRTSEPDLPGAPQLRTGAAQEISIRIAQPDASTIDLRVVERSGQLHVDVRTSDAAMQTSLRQDLGMLTNSLDRAGYHSETFIPSSTLGRTASSAQMGNQDDGKDPSQSRQGSADPSGGRRQQQQQKRPSTWLEEMEDQQ
jgi:hypothetical protein